MAMMMMKRIQRLSPPSQHYNIRTKQSRRILQSSLSSATPLQTTPIVIIGGGPTGLTLSTLLSQYNIPSTLIESKSLSTIHQQQSPQAHYLNLRTMEILRHYIPNAYHHVMECNSMKHVEHWECFTFGHSILGKQIGRVKHPVRGIKRGQDGNGILLDCESNDNSNYDHEINMEMDVDRISICNPGHLAQNKFASILFQEAQRASTLLNDNNNKKSTSHIKNNHHHTAQIIHGESVIQITHNHDHLRQKYTSSYPLQVHTSSGQTFQTKYVIAADGSSSSTRKAHGNTAINNKGMSGNASMQHLINVHFRTSSKLTNIIMKEKVNSIGMLHFVFHQNLVGAFVCHDLVRNDYGDWVLQIPFFPPFQDFKKYDVDNMKATIASGLGVNLVNGITSSTSTSSDIGSIEVEDSDIDILSIKPWTMAATVAPSYFIGEANRIILAGDAGHVFPPAGGFGMNTGIQDAHNLAWKLACVLKIESDEEFIGKNDDSTATLGIHSILKSYEKERRPIASQNAALSVRNYNRTLGIAKACYLNADHPALLCKVMDSPPMNLLPLHVRQQMFEVSVQMAMAPLSNLAYDRNLFSQRITKNVRNILRSGGGLPLLFPRYEVGFSYNNSSSLLDEDDDTAGFYPSLEVGLRLPHIPVKHVGQELTISLTDVESQLRSRWNNPSAPRFSIIIFDSNQSTRTKHLNDNIIVDDVSAETSVIEVYSDPIYASKRLKECLNEQNDHVVLHMISTSSTSIKALREKSESGTFSVLVRPDGHVENIII